MTIDHASRTITLHPPANALTPGELEALAPFGDLPWLGNKDGSSTIQCSSDEELQAIAAILDPALAVRVYEPGTDWAGLGRSDYWMVVDGRDRFQEPGPRSGIGATLDEAYTDLVTTLAVAEPQFRRVAPRRY